MTITKEIEELWNTDEVAGLAQTLVTVLELIGKAYKNEERIPLELECEIILTANDVLGYGNVEGQAIHIIGVFRRAMKDDSYLQYHKFNKFASLAASSLLTAMTNDEQENSRSANVIMGVYGSSINSTRFELLELLYTDLIKSATKLTFNKWSLETTAFTLTYSCILENFDKWSNSLDVKRKSLSEFVKSHNQTSIFLDWKESWLTNSDYLRLSTLMIWGSFVNDEMWQDKAEALFS